MATADTKATAATLAMVYSSKPLPSFTGKWFSLFPWLSLSIRLLGPGLGLAGAEAVEAAEVSLCPEGSTPFARFRSNSCRASMWSKCH